MEQYDSLSADMTGLSRLVAAMRRNKNFKCRMRLVKRALMWKARAGNQESITRLKIAWFGRSPSGRGA